MKITQVLDTCGARTADPRILEVPAAGGGVVVVMEEADGQHLVCLCSVCVTFLGRFYDSLKENDVKFNDVEIEKAMLRSCKDAKGKENRFVSHLRDKIHL